MTGQDPKNICLLCERDSSTVPLLTLEYRGGSHHICTQHLPVLIHHPDQLAQKLPGAEHLQPPDIQD